MAEPEEGEEVFAPGRNGGGRRVPLERPPVAPKVDRTGRDPDGPKTAKFRAEDVDDAEFEAGARKAAGASPRVAKKDDKALQNFLNS